MQQYSQCRGDPTNVSLYYSVNSLILQILVQTNKYNRHLVKILYMGILYYSDKRKFYSPCQFHFVGRVRPSGCPTDIKNFLTMPVLLAKFLDRHENFFYILKVCLKIIIIAVQI